MKRKFNTHRFRIWMRNVKDIAAQLIIPLTIFQAIRTLFLPTTFDILLLAIFIAIAIFFHLEWI